MTSSRLSTAGKMDLNKLLPVDRPAHDWYRFVLSFPPHLVRDYLQRFGIDRRQCVLDPFCGTGTTLVECKKLGVPSVGIEANPMACFASKTKTDWLPDSKGLLRHAQIVAEKVLERLGVDGIEDESFPLFQDGRAGHPSLTSSSLRRLAAQAEKLILAHSISALPLHKTLTLLDCLRKPSPNYGSHELLALAKAIVFSISNLHFGPEVGLGRIKSDAPVVSAWLANVRAMAGDLQELHRAAVVPCEVHQADSRQLSNLVEPESIDAVITSPP